MILASKLGFKYPGAGKPALAELDFTIRRGSLACVLGGNGSGKSTLLALLAGLFGGFAGSLQVGGHDAALSQKEVRRLCGLVPQNPDVYLLGSTLREDMRLGLSREQARGEEADERAVALAHELGLDGLEDEPLQTLSFGQRRKASLAAALMHRPELLLLDEPFSGLDFEAQLHLREIIQESRKQELTQVVVSHDLELIADLADYFILLKDGKIMIQGDRETVFPMLREGNIRPPCWWLQGQSGPGFF